VAVLLAASWLLLSGDPCHAQVAFQLSALYSFAEPEPAAASGFFWAGLYTAVGAVCFPLGSYLMVPELFDEEDTVAC